MLPMLEIRGLTEAGARQRAIDFGIDAPCAPRILKE
jgi:hypothetical protein